MADNIDLNLLFLAESLYRHGNVSRAAKDLNLSQSAASHALNRLRDYFHDPMFVRMSKGVVATPFAKSLEQDILDLTNKVRDLSQRIDNFDPKKEEGRITIATTDYVEILLMAAVRKRLKEEAPRIQLSIRPTIGELPKNELETGVYDLAVAGFYEDLPEGFYRSKLFVDRFATAFRRDHPLAKNGRISEDDYFSAEHALITLQGDFKDRVSAKMPKSNKKRSLVYGTTSFTSMAWTLSKSDLLLTAPEQLLKAYVEYFPIVVQECPVELEGIKLQMVWHGVSHSDPLKKWFRELLKIEAGKLLS